MTTIAAPNRRTVRALARKSASPSLRLIELTIDLPCTHLRPASMTDHFELSIMIGNARDFGLGGDVVQELGHRPLGVEHALVHVDVEDVGAAAHLLERDIGGTGPVAGDDQPSRSASSR